MSAPCPSDREEPTRTLPSVFHLSWIFLRLGTVAFGGLGAALSLFQRDLVERRHWLTAEDIRDALAYTKPLPGSTVVQVVTFLGWRLRGWRGAIAASIAFVAPSALMMIAAAAGAIAMSDTSLARGALTGLQVAVVGLLAAAMWRLAQSEAKGRGPLVMLLGALALGFVLHPVLIVVGAGLIGMALGRRKEHA